MEVDLRGGPERHAAPQNLVARAADRLPQSVIEPDASDAKAVVIFARAAADVAIAAVAPIAVKLGSTVVSTMRTG